MVIRLCGDWTLATPTPAPEETVRDLAGAGSLRKVAFDSGALGVWNTALLTFLARVLDACDARGVEVDATGLPEGACDLLGLAKAVPDRGESAEKAAGKMPFLELVGKDAVEFVHAAGRVVGFFVQVLRVMGRFFTGRTRVRRVDLLLCIQDAGVRGVPIISLITFLVGVTLAYVGAAQLAAFGAKIFVANLVGLAMAREMAPMMTAIIAAGRTGAAYAAQLGTMMVNEEIDALETLGLEPMETLVLPRVLALTLMMPLLVIYANLMGNLGGAAVAILGFNVGPHEYFSALKGAVAFGDFAEGLVKSVVYGLLVGVSGCLQGMNSGRSASAVGTATTSAVVMSIVAIVSASAVLTAVFDTIRRM